MLQFHFISLLILLMQYNQYQPINPETPDPPCRRPSRAHPINWTLLMIEAITNRSVGFWHVHSYFGQTRVLHAGDETT